MDKTNAVTALSALAQDTRLDIFRLLVETGPKGLPVGAIGERFGLPSATLSHHLALLKQAGLVSCHREGRRLIHTANYPRMNALLAYLTDKCCVTSAEDCDDQPWCAQEDDDLQSADGVRVR